MQKRICPICDHPMQHTHYCSFCRQWIKEPHYVNATYYLNERHPAKETNCEYHNMGDNILEKNEKTGADTLNEFLERAKTFIDTHTAKTSKGKNNSRQKSPKISIAKIMILIVAVMYVVNFLYNMILALLWWI